MTQPPDDRPRPPDDAEGQASPDEPTVAWTPPEPEPDEPTDRLEPSEPPTPAGPIISASPSTPSPPGTSDVSTPDVPPGSGWQVPVAAAALEQRDGYVIAGIGARFVAWLIDVLLAGIIPVALSLMLVNWPAIIRDAIDQARLAPQSPMSSFAYDIPVTLDLVLLTLIGLGVQYLYFVGFWTSGLRATPGMLGLKMRVVDAGTGSTLSIVQATKRWIALGWPLGLLVLVPVLQNASNLIQFAWVLVLFFTIVLHERRQGLHDQFAGSLVIRSVTSGDGATIVGCLVWLVLFILLIFIVSTLVLAQVLPELMQYIQDLPQNTA